MLSNTAGIIGLGLIGGSLAKSIKKQDPDCRITAYDTDRASLLQAQLAGDIDAISEEIDDAFADCDIIFLCAPVSVNLKYMELVKPYLKDDAILTDVGSTKTGIMERAAELGLQKYFIGGHPMAGSERSGYANASDLLFENAFYIITPFQETHAKKQLRLIEFVHRIPALPMVMEAEEHDRTVATVSHIPHIIAFALVNLLRDSDDLEGTMRRIAAGGFKDITRIANSSPEMWEAICMENRPAIEHVLDDFERELDALRGLIANGDREGLYNSIRKSGDFRNSLDDRSAGAIQREYALTLDIPDVAGSIAGVLNILAVHRVNIKNLGILHNRENGEAILKIDFYNENSLVKAADVLERNDYRVYRK